MTMAFNFIKAIKNKLIGNNGYYAVQQQSVFEELKSQAKHAYWFELNGRECLYYVFHDESRIAASNYFIREMVGNEDEKYIDAERFGCL